jgi:hypothetical protein
MPLARTPTAYRTAALMAVAVCACSPVSADTLRVADLDGSNGFRIDGSPDEGIIATEFSRAGDVNADGVDDFVFGASAAAFRGQAYVLFGRADGTFPARFDAASLDGTAGFRMVAGPDFNLVGTSVSGAGDVNGDGIDDLIISALRAQDRRAVAFVVFGRADGRFPPVLALDTLDGRDGFRIVAELPGPFPTVFVKGAGDLNHDGLDDVMLASRVAASPTPQGRVHVVFGRPNFLAEVPVDTLDGSNGFSISASSSAATTLRPLAAARDFNGDGINDVVLSEPHADFGGEWSGSTYVVFGRADGFPPTWSLDAIDGSNGIRIDGTPFSLSGSAGSVVDLDGDGLDDILVGASADHHARGTAFVVFGRADTAATPVIPVTDLEGSNGFRIEGEFIGQRFADAVAGLGDINGDGREDAAFLAPQASPEGESTGRAHVIHGRDRSAFGRSFPLDALDGSNGFRVDGSEGAALGDLVAAAGDLNGDGVSDFALGGYYALFGHGSIHVVFGGASRPQRCEVVASSIPGPPQVKPADPLCRCFEDLLLSRSRCHFDLPDFDLGIRIPRLRPAGFEALWNITPLTADHPHLRLRLGSATGLLQGDDVRIHKQAPTFEPVAVTTAHKLLHGDARVLQIDVKAGNRHYTFETAATVGGGVPAGAAAEQIPH